MNPEDRDAWNNIRSHYDHDRDPLPKCDNHDWDNVAPEGEAGVLLRCTTCGIYDRTGTRSYQTDTPTDLWEDDYRKHRRADLQTIRQQRNRK